MEIKLILSIFIGIVVTCVIIFLGFKYANKMSVTGSQTQEANNPVALSLCDVLPANYSISCPSGKKMVINDAKYYRPPDSKCLLITTDPNSIATGTEPEFIPNNGNQSFYESCDGVNITSELSQYVDTNGKIDMPSSNNYGKYNIGGTNTFTGGLLNIPDPCPGKVKQLDINYTCV